MNNKQQEVTVIRNLASRDELQQRMGYAICYLNDLSKLNQSSLSRLVYVDRLAKNKYHGCILPRGRALRQLLLASINQVTEEVGQEPSLRKACQYLQLRADGHSCQEISAQMGLSREHISRHHRRIALNLAAEAFLNHVENNE